MATTNAKNEEGKVPLAGAWLEPECVLGTLQEENRSLKIKIAGVDTLSSLLRGTRDELETVCAEKESLEMEVSRLQCRCSLLEKDLATAKNTAQNTTGQTKNIIANLMKENKKLKNELKCVKNQGNGTESIFGPEAMCELLAFRGELENEILNLQKAMNSHEEESSISQVSRLLGQVTKLEYQLKTKEEESQELRNKTDCLLAQLENYNQIAAQNNSSHSENGNLVAESTIDVGIQTCVRSEEACTQTEASIESPLSQEPNTDDYQLMMNQAKEVVLRKKTSSVKRKSSKRASGDWNQIRKTYSDVFDDEWSVDTINTSEQLKITQELLVQANKIIMTMTEENEKLLRVNAMLLQDITQGENIQLNDRQKVLDRFKFLFTESSFENCCYDMKQIQDILIDGDVGEIDDNRDICHVDNLHNHESIIEENQSCQNMEEDKSENERTNESCDTVDKLDCGKEELNAIEIEKPVEKIAAQARDSGVDIYPTEHEKQVLSPGNAHFTTAERSKSSNMDILLDENSKLTAEVEAYVKKLAKAAEKISLLEDLLKLMKNKETEWKDTLALEKPQKATERLSKSIGHIPSSVRTTTYRRMVLQSDV